MNKDNEQHHAPGSPDDDYLLTAYLFGDITQAGKEEVDRRLEESDET